MLRRAVTSLVRRQRMTVFSKRAAVRSLSTSKFARSSSPEETVSVTFRDQEGGEETYQAKLGESLLDVALKHDLDIEGACGGTLACSTCHVILDKASFDKLDEPEEEELDMLDLAIGLTDTSRLGCQVRLTKELDGIVATIPDETSDARSF